MTGVQTCALPILIHRWSDVAGIGPAVDQQDAFFGMQDPVVWNPGCVQDERLGDVVAFFVLGRHDLANPIGPYHHRPVRRLQRLDLCTLAAPACDVVDIDLAPRIASMNLDEDPPATGPRGPPGRRLNGSSTAPYLASAPACPMDGIALRTISPPMISS